jgi:uncharacterized protein YegP (UPF0339 family)
MHFESYEDKADEYRWRLLADNGQKIAASGQSFASKSNAERAARGFKASAKTDAYEVWDTSSSYYWHAKSSNGEIVATGGQAFVSRYDAQRAADNVRDNAGSATNP